MHRSGVGTTGVLPEPVVEMEGRSSAVIPPTSPLPPSDDFDTFGLGLNYVDTLLFVVGALIALAGLRACDRALRGRSGA